MTDRPVLRALASGAAALTLAACFGGTLPARQFYRLTIPDTAPVTLPDSADGTRTAALPAGSVAIAPYETPGLYGDGGIVYRIGDAQYGTYPAREWALPLSDMLGVLTQRVLEAVPLSSGQPIFDPPSRHASPFIWHGIVRRFEEVDRDRQVFADVELEARVIRSADDSVLWSGSVRLEQPVPQPTMDAIVDSLSGLARQGIATLAGEARAALAAPRPSATPPARNRR